MLQIVNAKQSRQQSGGAGVGGSACARDDATDLQAHVIGVRQPRSQYPLELPPSTEIGRQRRAAVQGTDAYRTDTLSNVAVASRVTSWLETASPTYTSVLMPNVSLPTRVHAVPSLDR